MIFEKPYSRIPALKDIVKDCERNTLSNALVAFLFTQTGPIATLKRCSGRRFDRQRNGDQLLRDMVWEAY